MQRIDHPTRDTVIEIQADYTPVSAGFFRIGDPSIPKAATQVTSTWLNGVQEELSTVIEIEGFTLDETDNTLLNQAINKKVTDGLGTLGTASTKDVGTANGQIPLMDTTGYPSADGSQITNIASNLPRGHIDGLTLQNGTDTDHDINVAVGDARDGSNAANMLLSSALVKQIDAPWAVGSAAGGNDQAQLDGAQTVTFTDNGVSDDFVTIDAGTWTVTPSIGDTLVVVGGTNAGSYQITAATTTQIDVATASFVADATSTSAIYTVKINTWYHTWLIRRSDTGVVDMLFSESATSPTLPASYNQKRRIGAVLTDASANIIQFFQSGDDFRWVTPIEDVALVDTLTTTARLDAISVPTGISVEAVFDMGFEDDLGGAVYVSSPLTADLTPVLNGWPQTIRNTVVNVWFWAQLKMYTNTSAQIRSRSFNLDIDDYRLVTHGWTDPRGKNG